MSAQPEALRLADECEQSGIEWRAEVHTRLQAAAELRRLHAEVEASDRNLCDLTDNLIKAVALLRQAHEALETDDWQKKLQAAIDIKHHLENGS
jgi:hypothetical protein